MTLDDSRLDAIDKRARAVADLYVRDYDNPVDRAALQRVGTSFPVVDVLDLVTEVRRLRAAIVTLAPLAADHDREYDPLGLDPRPGVEAALTLAHELGAEGV